MSDLKRRVEDVLEGRGELTAARFLSGEGLFIDGRMVVAVMGEDLCLPVDPGNWRETLSRPGVGPLLFAGVSVPGWVVVEGTALDGDSALSGWLDYALGT